MEHINALLTLLKYLFLGLFQGFTEAIPISSSGHLVLLRNLFQLDLPGLSFEIFVHFASLIAIITVYRKEILQIASHSFSYLFKKEMEKKADFQFSVLLLIATLPAGIFGLLFEERLGKLMTHTFLIGIALFITGIFLWIIRNKDGKKGDRDLTITHALIIGLAQAIAIFPGVSRSGATVIAAILAGLRKEVALKFSFLLYIPVSLGATILSIKDLWTDPQLQALFIPYVLAFLAALIATYFSLKWFIHLMMKGSLKYFAYYCLLAGVIVFLYFI